MLYQFELTTHCNLTCFYCPIETLKKVHMTFEKFCHLIDGIKFKSNIKLQGTGEAMLHPKFDEFMIYAREKGHYLEIITNGTIGISDYKLKNIDKIGFSIDTLDDNLANKSGRKYLDKVLNNLLHSHERAPEKCMVFSVAYGQELSGLQSFCKQYKIPHIIQNIQYKTSYQAKYKTKEYEYLKYQCSYIDENKMKYFFADGTEAPCCYMIDLKDVLSKKEIKEMFSKSIVPKCCEQCGELIEKKRLFR